MRKGYMLNQVKEQHTLRPNDLDGIIQFFRTQNHDDAWQGELYFDGIGVKVSYDLFTGDVGPIQFIDHKSVHVEYANDFQEVLKTQIAEKVIEAIGVFAKVYLLEHLLEYHDERVNKIIMERHG